MPSVDRGIVRRRILVKKTAIRPSGGKSQHGLNTKSQNPRRDRVFTGWRLNSIDQSWTGFSGRHCAGSLILIGGEPVSVSRHSFAGSLQLKAFGFGMFLARKVTANQNRASAWAFFRKFYILRRPIQKYILTMKRQARYCNHWFYPTMQSNQLIPHREDGQVRTAQAS